jgi:LuxR family maltose regulon positive regulatory protein
MLVLDDYHFIEEPSIHRSLAYLIDRLPDQGHLLILTRSDPPLPTPLLRGRGQLLEIRQDELAFLDEEAADFLMGRLDLDLTLEDVRLLNAKTEGWAGGLQLAAVSLQGQKDPGRYIRSFTGTNRYVLDYLVSEVLGRLEPGVRQFLLQTAILDVLSAELCAAVTDLTMQGQVHAQSSVANAQAMLENLHRANLFVIPLDDEHTSFRYHHLFADLLRRQLSAAHPELVRSLHARASAWFELHGQAEQAVQHALLGQDYGRSAALLTVSADGFWNRGEQLTLWRLLRSLPEAFRAESPNLLIYEAVSCVSAGHLDDAEQRLRQIDQLMARRRLDQAEANEMLGRVAAVGVLIAAYRGEAGRALDCAQVAREHLSPCQTAWISRYAVAAGNVLLMAGRFREGRDEMASAMQAGKDGDSPYIYLVAARMLSLLAWTHGQPGEAWRLVQEARAYLRANDLDGAPIDRGISVVEGILLLEQGLLDEAEARIAHGLQGASLVEDYSIIALAYLGLVMCKYSRRDWQGATDILGRAEHALENHEYPIWTECVLAGLRSTVMIKQGRLQEAEQYLLRRQIIPDGAVTYPHQNEYLSLALLLVELRRFEAAEGVIVKLEQYCAASEMRLWLIAARLQGSRIALAYGRQTEAQDSLRSAWDVASSMGRYHEFQNLAPELLGLFRQAVAPSEVPEPVWRLIMRPAGVPFETMAGGPRSAEDVPNERLSERELEVLRLIAAGWSNREIAQRLHVEIQTVKFHAGNIYGKLAVANRLQAVARAQELGILSPTAGVPRIRS